MNTSETLEDIPLKKNEIMRFLNASKNTSFKNDEGSLIAKKETTFKRRSLIEIAEQTANKLKLDKDKENLENSLKEVNKIEKTIEKENEEKEINLEDNKIEELQKKVQELTDINNAKDKEIEEKYLKGLEDGEKKVNKEYESKLNQSLNALEQAKNLILGINSSQFIELREEMIKTIISLASERSGNEIKDLPEKFFEKIEKLIENIDQKTRTPKIFLNEKDLEFINKYMIENSEQKYDLIKDEKLMSGEVIIEVGSIKVVDTFESNINQSINEDEKTMLKK